MTLTFKNRRVWLIAALVVGTVALLSLFAAPQAANLQRGSTYSRAPDGYGAWFAYMQQQGTPVQRWQRPMDSLFTPSGLPAEQVVPIANNRSNPPPKLPPRPPSKLTPKPSSTPPDGIPTALITMIGIGDRADRLLPPNEEWIRQGNVLVLLGVPQPVSAAPFSALLRHPAGVIRVETARRRDRSSSLRATVRLSDQYGAVVWEETKGRGKVIYAVTPHLAANAYQAVPGNFKFLASLVQQPGYPIYINEYIHGYKDQAAIAQDQAAGNAFSYLARTPIALLAMQAAVILLVLIVAKNQRFGSPTKLSTPQVDHSEAYIQALGTVLHKAECSEFVLEVVGKAEQLHVQRSLGLGNVPLELEAIATAWTQQTQRPTTELYDILRPAARKRRISERDLLIWLGKVQAMRQHLP